MFMIIQEAAVYRHGAYITRKGNVELKAGKQTLVIEGLSTGLDPSTVSLSVAPGVKGSNIRVEVLSDEQRNDRVSELSRQTEVLQNKIAIRKEQIEILKKNTDFSDKNDLDIEQMDAYISALPGKVEKIQEEVLDLEEQLKVKQKKLNERRKKLAAYLVKADLEADREGTYPIRLEYFENAASWDPFYEIRTREDEQVSLRLKAAVRQQTGEEWKDVALRLYTGDPAVSQNIPKLHPQYVDFYERPVLMSKAARMFAGGAMMESAPAVYDEEAMEDTVSFDRVENYAAEGKENDTMMEYVLPGSYTIDEHNDLKLELQEEKIPCRYHLIAIPKLSGNACLAAEVKTADIGKLLDSSADIYHLDTYLGNVYLEADPDKETYDLPLGKDESVSLRREQKKRYTSNILLKGQKKTEYVYALSVVSTKSKACEVTLYDQLPVSRDKSIVIEAQELSSASHDEETGELKWEFTLEPSEKKELQLAYDISWPKDKKLDI